MLGLLKKDFLLMKTQKNYLVLIIFIAVFLSYSSSDDFALSYLTLLSCFLVISSISYDDNGGCAAFLLTLPVSRGVYVREKYLFAALITGLGWLIGELSVVGVALTRGRMPEAQFFALAPTWYFGSILFVSILMPVMLKYGVERGRIVLFGIVMVALVVGYLSGMVFERIGVDPEAFTARLINGRTLPLLLLCGAATIAAALLSYGLSMRIMKRKEF